jgi:hypothetical protein
MAGFCNDDEISDSIKNREFLYLVNNYLLNRDIVPWIHCIGFHIILCSQLCLQGPCFHSREHLQIAVGDELQIWKVTENVFSKQSWTSEKGCSSCLGLGGGYNP